MLGLAVDGHAQTSAGLIDQVDGLVWQEPVGDIAVRQGRRRDNRGIGDPHAMVDFVLLLQPAQDRDRVLNRRLGHGNRLEPAGKGRVLLDILAIFVEGRGTDTMQIAPRQCGFQHVGGIHGAIGFASPDKGVQLVDEQDHLAVTAGNIGQNRFQAFLKLTPELCPSDQRTHVERHQLAIA